MFFFSNLCTHYTMIQIRGDQKWSDRSFLISADADQELMSGVAIIFETSSLGTYFYNYFHKYAYLIFPDWCFPKLSPWRKDLDKFIRMLQEGGIMDYYKLKTGFYLTRQKFLESKKEKNNICWTPVVSPMNMQDILPLFYVLGLGIFFSLIIFLIEYLMGSIKSHKKVVPTI